MTHEENSAGGRPSKYKPEFAVQAEKLCKLGATDADLADFFEVSERTINRWQIEHEEFCRSTKAGKAESDDRVERSLYHKAVGYTFESEKIFQFQGEIVRAETKEHVPPDTTACIFWLKNRRRDQWRDRHDVDHGVQSENPLATFLDSLAGKGKTLQPVDEPDHSTKADADDEPGPRF